MEYLKEHFTEEDIFCLEGADPANTWYSDRFLYNSIV